MANELVVMYRLLGDVELSCKPRSCANDCVEDGRDNGKDVCDE